MEVDKENGVSEKEKAIEDGKGQESVKRKYDKQPLSIREKAFIKAFTEIGSETYGLAQEAALKAGYVKAQVEHSARRLMQNPKVLVAINAIYAERMEASPTNVARIMANLDNCEALALKAKSMPTLTKIAELKGKYLDLFSANNAAADSEALAKRAARMTAEDKKIALLVAKCRTSAEARAKLDGECTPELRGELTETLKSISKE